MIIEEPTFLLHCLPAQQKICSFLSLIQDATHLIIIFFKGVLISSFLINLIKSLNTIIHCLILLEAIHSQTRRTDNCSSNYV